MGANLLITVALINGGGYTTKEERVACDRRVHLISHSVGSVYWRSLFPYSAASQGEGMVNPCTCELHNTEAATDPCRCLAWQTRDQSAAFSQQARLK
jgi:hypothetical protein